jgi:hypothetical protein
MGLGKVIFYIASMRRKLFIVLSIALTAKFSFSQEQKKKALIFF